MHAHSLLFSFSSSSVTFLMLLCHDSLVPYLAMDAPRRSRRLFSVKASHLSTCAHRTFRPKPRPVHPRPDLPSAAARGSSSAARYKITCKCLVTVPASFRSENVLIWSSGNPFHFGKAHSCHAPPCCLTLPGSQTTLLRSRPWRNRFRNFALLEILTYSNDHSLQ